MKNSRTFKPLPFDLISESRPFLGQLLMCRGRGEAFLRKTSTGNNDSSGDSHIECRRRVRELLNNSVRVVPRLLSMQNGSEHKFSCHFHQKADKC